MMSRADIYNGSVLVHPNVPIVDGEVSCDRGSKVRWNGSLVMGVDQSQKYPLLSKDQSRVKVYRGISSIGSVEVLQLGEYRVEEIDRSGKGTMGLTLTGLESYIADARFLRPIAPYSGLSTVEAIKQLASAGIPGNAPDKFKARNTKDKLVTDRAPWVRDRIDVIAKLAESINSEFFVDNTGTPSLVNIPDLAKTVPVFMINQGSGGVLVSQNVKDTRDKVYNAVSVAGNNGEVWAIATDDNPLSPTYFNGPYGQKPKFYTSQYLYTIDQCQTLANRLLAESLASSDSISFTAAPIPFLEAGDVVYVQLENGTVTKHLLEKVSIGLGVGGTMSAETISIEASLAEGLSAG